MKKLLKAEKAIREFRKTAMELNDNEWLKAWNEVKWAKDYIIKCKNSPNTTLDGYETECAMGSK